jgi:hypothetical protein
MMNSENVGFANDESLSATAANETTSQSSAGRSLLERIRLQQQRELAPTAQIQVPQYNPYPTNNNTMANQYAIDYGTDSNETTANMQSSLLGKSTFFSDAWTNLQSSLETGGGEDTDALIVPSHQRANNGEYSLKEYFLTFVRDVYGGFLRLPVVVRILVVILLLYIALELLD